MEVRLKLPHEIPNHWENVKQALSHAKWSPVDLITAIDKCRISAYKQVKDMSAESRFSGLSIFFKDSSYIGGNPELFWGDHTFCHHNPDPYLKGWFLAHTVPFIAQLVLDLPHTFPSGVFQLNTEDNQKQELCLTKVQCATLLACSFFSAFHHSSAPSKRYVNFDQIYITLNPNHKCPQNLAKFCMIMNYFERCRLKLYNESTPVTICRLHNLQPKSASSWEASSYPLTDFSVHTTGSINDAGSDLLHADFANRRIGGGVLNRGSVQEEIMFSICPELLTTIPLCGVMNQNEAIVISGAEEFSNHKGYSKGLKFIGNATCSEGVVSRVALDATRFRDDKTHMRQYSEETILRELNKAFVAFNHDYPRHGSAVATGNWGCGAFGGHVQLKSMLQWIAASACDRPVRYYTFEDPNCEGLEEITHFLKGKNLTTGQLFEEIRSFAAQVEPRDSPKNQLFQHLRDTFQD